MSYIFRLILLASLACLVLGCGKGKCRKGKGKGCIKPRQPDKEEPSPGNVVQRMVGNDVQTEPYTPGSDSPVDTCDKLNCNVDDSCCWMNNLPPADHLNYVKASGQGEAAKMQSSFGTTTQPEGSYFLTASEVAGNTEQTAQLYSCQVCSQGPTTVKVKHWQSRGVQIKVCHIHDIADQPANCQPLPGTSGNEDSVQLPADPQARIAIIATGFTEPTGSVAIVDDISVQCDQCVSTTAPPPPSGAPPPPATPAPTEPPAKPPCKEIVCNFESGNACAYQAASSSGNANENWKTTSAPYQNRLTGVPKPGEGNKFGACYTKKKGEKSAFETNAAFDRPYVVRFNYYKATQGVNLKACCDSESNCPYGASPSVQTSDYRAWKTASIKCPQGTKKFVIICENLNGESEGACGIDNIQLFEDAENPDSASKSACGGQ